MKFFDRVNLVGRIFIGIYFIIEGIDNWNFAPTYYQDQISYLIYFIGFWETIGGIFLMLGIKPRATAAVLALILILSLALESYLILSIKASSLNLRYFKSFLIPFGALLFLAGTRMIPHGLLIRSEDSMNEKYGGKK